MGVRPFLLEIYRDLGRHFTRQGFVSYVGECRSQSTTNIFQCRIFTLCSNVKIIDSTVESLYQTFTREQQKISLFQEAEGASKWEQIYVPEGSKLTSWRNDFAQKLIVAGDIYRPPIPITFKLLYSNIALPSQEIFEYVSDPCTAIQALMAHHETYQNHIKKS